MTPRSARGAGRREEEEEENGEEGGEGGGGSCSSPSSGNSRGGARPAGRPSPACGQRGREAAGGALRPPPPVTAGRGCEVRGEPRGVTRPGKRERGRAGEPRAAAAGQARTPREGGRRGWTRHAAANGSRGRGRGAGPRANGRGRGRKVLGLPAGAAASGALCASSCPRLPGVAAAPELGGCEAPWRARTADGRSRPGRLPAKWRQRPDLGAAADAAARCSSARQLPAGAAEGSPPVPAPGKEALPWARPVRQRLGTEQGGGPRAMGFAAFAAVRVAKLKLCSCPGRAEAWSGGNGPGRFLLVAYRHTGGHQTKCLSTGDKT